jgi:hypothetical protein
MLRKASDDTGGSVARAVGQETGFGDARDEGRNYGREREREAGREARETMATAEDDERSEKQRRETARDEKMVVRHEGDGEKILATEGDRRRAEETDEEEYVMSSTAYPGQQWEPEYYWS